MTNVFSSKFVSAVRSFLNTACADAKNVSREAVAEHLATVGIVATPELVGLAVSSGAINSDKAAYDLFKGRYGGIREVDPEALKAVQAEMAAEQAKREAVLARLEKARAARAAKKNATQATASA